MKGSTPRQPCRGYLNNTPGAEDVEDTEPAKDSATRKVQHPVYFISSVLRDAWSDIPLCRSFC